MTFRTRTFIALLVTTTAALAVSTALISSRMRDGLLTDVEDGLRAQVRLAAELLADRGEPIPAGTEAEVLGGLIDARVTFIDDTGRVLGDSQVPAHRLPDVDNHLQREEIQEALAGEIGIAVRQSATTGVLTMYVASAVRRGPIRFVRIGVPLTSIDEQVAETRRLAWLGLAVGLVVALLLTWGTSALLSRRIQAIAHLAQRFRNGDFSRPRQDFGDDEIAAVARALDETARDLGSRLEEVARERAHMDAVLQGMIEGALLVDGQGRLVLSNPAIRSMLRLTDAPQGKHFLELVRNPDIAAQLTAALAGQRPEAAEVQVDRQSRQSFITRVVPVETTRGGGAVLVLYDVTDMRRADQVRRDFVANVSHELRTPLTAIRGYVEALTDTVDDESQSRRFLDIIARHAARMERLVNDLLRLARLDARQEQIQPAAVQVDVLLDQVLTEMESAAIARNVTMSIDDGARGVVLTGDPAKLHDVFRNLTENAINYSPEGGDIVISSAVDQQWLDLSISDRGPGIPEAELPRIFERFYRVDRSRTRDPRDPGGTGLGLSIVRHLVELHGGRVSACNRDGGGTTVTVRLPLAPSA